MSKQQDIRSFFKKKPATTHQPVGDGDAAKPAASGGPSADEAPSALPPAEADKVRAKEKKKRIRELEQRCIVEMAGDIPTPVTVFALPPMFKSTTMVKESKIFTSSDSLEDEGGGRRAIKQRGELEIVEIVDEKKDQQDDGGGDSHTTNRSTKKRKKPPEWTKASKKGGKDDAIHQQARKVKALKKRIASYQFLNCQAELEGATAELEEANRQLFALWDSLAPNKPATTTTPVTTTTTTTAPLTNPPPKPLNERRDHHPQPAASEKEKEGGGEKEALNKRGAKRKEAPNDQSAGSARGKKKVGPGGGSTRGPSGKKANGVAPRKRKTQR